MELGKKLNKSIPTRLYVIKVSGSLFFSDEYQSFVKGISQIASSRTGFVRLILVCGGGRNARAYIDLGRKLNIDEASLDEIGIAVSRLNALALSIALGRKSYRPIPTDLTALVELASSDKIPVIVMGGLHPGQSTNAVAAIVAEKLRADMFVNATDVEGVYTKDPRKFKGAKLLPEVGVSDLTRILGGESLQAGGYELMDPVALKLIQRSKIPTVIAKCDPVVLKNLILNGVRSGTRVLV